MTTENPLQTPQAKANLPLGAFHQRVIQAAEAVLSRDGSVGPLELFQQMRFLEPAHLEQWRKGHPAYPFITGNIRVGPEKFQNTLKHFRDWVRQLGLKPVQKSYNRRSPTGVHELRITESGTSEEEAFYRTHYTRADLPARKAAAVKKKLEQAPDLVVFEKVGDEGACSECGTELGKGALLVREQEEVLCLACADMDHLVFLPAGDTALTRRARKHSPLSAVVVRFSRARKRYERQGALVTEAALKQAEADCAADAPERAAARQRAVTSREVEDQDFVRELTAAILQQFPGCPAEEAQEIAAHAGQRSSGRVMRSEAGRALDPKAIWLAVAAHVRHQHTRYDELLMRGVDRQDARLQVREEMDRVLGQWSP